MNQLSNDLNGPYNNYPPPMAPAKTNGKSIATLILGILSIIVPYIGFILGIIAIIFASISLKEIKNKNEQGRGLAIAGLVCGIVGTVLYGIILAFLVAFLFLSSASIGY